MYPPMFMKYKLLTNSKPLSYYSLRTKILKMIITTKQRWSVPPDKTRPNETLCPGAAEFMELHVSPEQTYLSLKLVFMSL